MSLIDIWTSSRDQLADKHLQQIIAFAGEGRLADGNQASSEFREFLHHISSDLLVTYANQCLVEAFTGSGFALQDIVNQIGQRIGLDVVDGRYRGIKGAVGCDGIWTFPDGHAVVMEVKTTDAYRIDIETIAGYRRDLAQSGEIAEGSSSTLIVVGRADTGGLEAQIRGSRYAWDVRLISVDALVGLLRLKEEVEDPDTVQRIYALLIPREFTKLDEIIDIVFSATEEVKAEEIAEDEEEISPASPVSFNEACVAQIGHHLGRSFIKRSRTTFSTPDQQASIVCAVSKAYFRGEKNAYWFAFHPHQKEFLEKVEDAFVAYGCGTEQTVILIPFSEYSQWLDGMHTTVKKDRFYWHVHISEDNGDFNLNRKKGEDRIRLTPYLVPP